MYRLQNNVEKTLARPHVVGKRNDVMQTMQQLDLQSNAERRAHRLQRRKYANTGPNFVWHADGYDKLKHFGL